MAKNSRFEKIYSQGTMTVTEIWVDKVTGVNYIFHQNGQPVISPVVNPYNE